MTESSAALLASKSKFTVDEIVRYLGFLKSPTSFKNGQAAAQGFNRLINVPPVREFNKDKLDEFIIINSNIETAISTSPELAAFRVPDNTSPSSLAHGMLRDYPQYTSLFYSSHGHYKLVEQLKQLLWVECSTASSNDIYDYCLFIRVLSENPIPQYIVDRFPTKDPTTDGIFEVINEFYESEKERIKESTFSNKNLLSNTQAALRYLKAITGRKVIRRTRSGDIKTVESRNSLGVRGFVDLGSNGFVRDLITSDEDELYEKGAIRSYDTLEIAKDELEELLSQGVEPAEIEKERQILFFLDISTPLFAQLFRAKIKGQGQVASIVRQNQYLPSSVHLLNELEARAVLKHLESTEVQSKHEAALVLTLYVMLFTSSTFDRAKSFTVLTGVNDSEVWIDDGVGYDFELNAWIIPRLKLPFMTAEMNFEDAKQPINRIMLPVHTSRVRELVQEFFMPQKKVAKPLTRIRLSRADITKALRQIDERITPAKVSNYLLLSLASSTSLSVAGYLFNRAYPGSLARYYYSSHSETIYSKTYNELILKALPACNFDSLSSVGTENRLNDVETGFGARYVPTLSGVKEVLYLMRKDFYGAWRENKKHAFIDFHNWYTVYSIFAQSLLTGARSVTDPLISTKQLIDSTGLAVFRDKDTEDQFHTRILPMHPLAVDIAREYERHRLLVLEKALMINPRFCRTEFLKTDTTFFIEPSNAKPIQAKPSNIQRFLNAFSLLPINSNRKLLRTYLEAQSVTPETIDATLGHASIGEPIGDTMSTFSFIDLRNELFPALDKLIKDVGLSLLKGLEE